MSGNLWGIRATASALKTAATNTVTAILSTILASSAIAISTAKVYMQYQNRLRPAVVL